MFHGEPSRVGAARVQTGHSRVGACYGFRVSCGGRACLEWVGACYGFCVRVWGACSLGARVLGWVLGGSLEGVLCCEGRVGVRSWPTPSALLAHS